MTNPISTEISLLGANEGYYNALKILPYIDRTMMFFITGARRIGKTTYYTHLAINLYLHHGIKTMWIRNKKVELADPSFYSGFLYDAKRFGWCPDEWTANESGIFTSEEKDADQVIYFQSVSTFSNRRGSGNASKLFIFDEFMPEDRRYPKHCATGLLSLTKTVFSNNPDCRVFCLSNTISAINPYYAAYRIYPSAPVITEYPDKHIVIEKCKDYKVANYSKNNPWIQLYQNTGYQEYADESEDPRVELLVKRVPNGAKILGTVIRSNGTDYGLYRARNLIYVTERKGQIPNNFNYWTDDPNSVSARCTMLPRGVYRVMKEWLDAGTVRFVGANSMFDFLTIIFKTGI